MDAIRRCVTTSLWLRKIEWRSMIVASLMVLATFVPAAFFWNVSFATNSSPADTTIASEIGCGCGGTSASEGDHEITIAASEQTSTEVADN